MTGSGGPVLIANSALAVVCDIFGPTIAALTLGLYLQRQLPNRGSWRQVLGNKPLVAFGVSLMLFHFANAPLLPLVGQKLAQSHPTWATVLMSSCIVAAQLVMLPIALAAGAKAEAWGRKPILLAGFVILPIRALRYTASDHAAWLIGVQLLDGVGAGVLSILTPLVVADLMRGVGRYNFALGAVATAQGTGASVSGLASGVIVDRLGYSAAFVECGIAATAALAILLAFVPESRQAARWHRQVPSGHAAKQQ